MIFKLFNLIFQKVIFFCLFKNSLLEVFVLFFYFWDFCLSLFDFLNSFLIFDFITGGLSVMLNHLFLKILYFLFKLIDSFLAILNLLQILLLNFNVLLPKFLILFLDLANFSAQRVILSPEGSVQHVVFFQILSSFVPLGSVQVGIGTLS